MEFVKCTEADVDLLATLARETYEEAFTGWSSEENMTAYLDKAFNKEKVLSEIIHPDSEFYFLYVDKQLAGYLKVNEFDAQNDLWEDEGLELERIYLKAQYHGKSFGTALIKKGMELAVEKQKKYVWLGVWQKNHKALRVYEKLGFKKSGEHDFYMGEERQRDNIMKMYL